MPRLDPVEKVRRLSLALPQATEKEAWNTPTFRVGGKMFAMIAEGHHGEGGLSVWCKAPPGVQEVLVGAAPERFFVPPYVGHNGWIGVLLTGDVDWEELAELLADAHQMTAPKGRKEAKVAKVAKAAPAKRRRATRA